MIEAALLIPNQLEKHRMSNFFGSIASVQIAYLNTVYTLKPARCGLVGAAIAAARNLMNKEVPAHRLWAPFWLRAKIDRIEERLSNKNFQQVPYADQITTHIQATLQPDATPKNVGKSLRRLLLVADNTGLNVLQPTLTVQDADRSYDIPVKTGLTAQTIADAVTKARMTAQRYG